MSKKSNKPAVLFDLDGTLVDSTEDIADSLNRSLAFLFPDFKPYETETVKGFIGDGVGKLIERALPKGRSDVTLSDGVEAFKRVYRENLLNKTYLYPGVKDALPLFRGVYDLFVISNKNQDFSEAILDGFGVLNEFICVIGGDTLSGRKPAPVAVSHLEETFGSDRDRMVMIGDNHTDLQMAVNAGIPSIFCSFGMGEPGGVPFDYLADSFDEIPELLKKVFGTKTD